MEVKEVCEICGRLTSEYDKDWPCKKNHDWRKNWRKDKTSKKYKKYLARRKKAMSAAQRKKLEALNKKPPAEYKNREKKPGKYKRWTPEV